MIWARLLGMAAGLWLEAAPAVLGYGGTAAQVDRVLAPLIFAAALIAWSEVTRPVRWANLALGLVVAGSAWLLDYPVAGALNATVVGLLAAAAATVRGPIRQRYGGGWRALRRPRPGAEQPAAPGD